MTCSPCSGNPSTRLILTSCKQDLTHNRSLDKERHISTNVWCFYYLLKVATEK